MSGGGSGEDFPMDKVQSQGGMGRDGNNEISLTAIQKREMTNRKLWAQEEDIIILSLIEVYGTNSWISVAAEMKKVAPYPRSSKQIRERWYNQLSPEATKAPWTNHEEAALFSSHSSLGSKWKEIAVQLSGRTDNAVKNHFYSTVRRALRRMDKHFGFRDSTRKMRDLKPSALTHFLEVGQNLSSYPDMMGLILTFAQWKPKRQSKHDFQENSREIYDEILELISGYKKESRPTRRAKELMTQRDSSLQTGTDFESTESDKLSRMVMPQKGEEEGEDGEEESLTSVVLGEGFNYFGSQALGQSWFSMDEKEQELICDYNLLVASEDNQQ